MNKTFKIFNEEKHPIVQEYDALKKQSIKDLHAVIKQSHKISDVSDIKTKDHAASMILRAKHGNKAVNAAFGLDEDLSEARKLIGTYSHGDNTTKVYKLSGEHNEGDPYHVKLFQAGKHYEPADYYTNDHEDAHGTAKHMVMFRNNPIHDGLKEDAELSEGYLSKQHLEVIAKHSKDKDLMQMVNNYHNALKAGDHEEAKLHGSIVRDILHDKEMSEGAASGLDEELKLGPNHTVDGHPAAAAFTKEYVAAHRGDHRESGPTEKDQAAYDKFYNKYERATIHSGFAGSGTHHYANKETGEKYEVMKHASSKGFYGTTHYVRKLSDIKEMKTFKQFSHSLAESAMSELHANIGNHLDRHIETFKSYGGSEALMNHMSNAATKIARYHKITKEQAHSFVRDYVESSLENNN